MRLFPKKKDKYKRFKDQEYFYTDDSNNFYFKSFHSGNFELVKDVDLKSITFLSNTYFVDNNRIYHESKCIKKNYSTFKDYKQYGYFKIDNELYWFGKKVKSNFTGKLKNIQEHFFTDDLQLFVNGKAFDFDKDSFKCLNKFYAKDSTIVFHSSELINSADSETFRVIKEDSGYSQELINQYPFIADDEHSAWACDKNSLYFCGEPFLQGQIDPSTTRVIKSHILLDKQNVYYHKKLVKEADPDSFECIIDSSKVDSPMNSIMIFTSFFKDKNNLFYLYEDEQSDSKNEIIKCTQQNKKKYIDALKRIEGNFEHFNFNEQEIDYINNLLQ